MLSSHVLPCTDEHAKRSGVPKLDITGVPSTALAKMAGNAMNVPTVGCIILACALSLKPKVH